MTTDEAIESYIIDHSTPEPEWLAECRRDTWRYRLYPRMCSGPVQGRVLTMLAALAAPMAVLELGTFSGYSAMALADGMPPGAQLHTVELDDEHADDILRAFSRSPRSADIHLHIGDALTLVPALPIQQWDMIFIDANKRDYPGYYRLALPRLRPGGILLADNTLWDGHVIDAADHAAQTEGIRTFNDLAAADPSVEVTILPLRDGLSVIRKKL